MISFREQLAEMINNELTNTPEWYFMMKRAWHLLQSDSITITDDDFGELENLVEGTTLDQQYSIIEAINQADFELVNELNEGFSPEGSFDENMKSVLDIYIGSIDEIGNINISTEDSVVLLQIATQRTFMAGPAVHIARELLDTIISFKEEIEQEPKIELPTNIGVYPNPSGDELKISNTLEFQNLKIEIFDEIGRLVFTQILDCSNLICIIDIQRLVPGIYFYKIDSERNSILNGKLIKQ
ncbi:MAG: T9SS type A sorting domain-containing protein [Chitinophagales bacterium]